MIFNEWAFHWNLYPPFSFILCLFFPYLGWIRTQVLTILPPIHPTENMNATNTSKIVFQNFSETNQDFNLSHRPNFWQRRSPESKHEQPNRKFIAPMNTLSANQTSFPVGFVSRLLKQGHWKQQQHQRVAQPTVSFLIILAYLPCALIYQFFKSMPQFTIPMVSTHKN